MTFSRGEHCANKPGQAVTGQGLVQLISSLLVPIAKFSPHISWSRSKTRIEFSNSSAFYSLPLNVHSTLSSTDITQMIVHYVPGGGGPSCIAAYAVMGIISTVTFVLRVYVRVRMVRRSWEDLAAGVGWLFFMSFTCLAIAGSFYGSGQHHNLVPSVYLPIALKV